ncbi:hypothetical protein HK098_004084 [Nowakowskiella sp. JEL0407]|nr:hypothetical protein HK098_004084 [Nowakowskiella sp. JEL0407]
MEVGVSSYSIFTKISEFKDALKHPVRARIHTDNSDGNFVNSIMTDASLTVEEKIRRFLPRTMLKYTVSDGYQELPAIELIPIMELSLASKLGIKIEVRNSIIRRGMLLLEPKNVTVIGGDIPEWNEEFILDRLERNLRAKLNMEPMIPENIPNFNNNDEVIPTLTTAMSSVNNTAVNDLDFDVDIDDFALAEIEQRYNTPNTAFSASTRETNTSFSNPPSGNITPLLSSKSPHSSFSVTRETNTPSFANQPSGSKTPLSSSKSSYSSYSVSSNLLPSQTTNFVSMDISTHPITSNPPLPTAPKLPQKPPVHNLPRKRTIVEEESDDEYERVVTSVEIKQPPVKKEETPPKKKPFSPEPSSFPVSISSSSIKLEPRFDDDDDVIVIDDGNIKVKTCHLSKLRVAAGKGFWTVVQLVDTDGENLCAVVQNKLITDMMGINAQQFKDLKQTTEGKLAIRDAARRLESKLTAGKTFRISFDSKLPIKKQIGITLLSPQFQELESALSVAPEVIEVN